MRTPAILGLGLRHSGVATPGHSEVGHSRDHLALQGNPGVGHSKDTLRLSTPGTPGGVGTPTIILGWPLDYVALGSLNSALGFVRGVPGDQAERPGEE